MKILVINWQCIKNPLGGGAEVHMHEIFKRICAMGNTVVNLVSNFDGAPDYEVIDGIEVYRRGKRNTFNFSVPKEYKKLDKKYNFDIIVDDINKIPFYSPLFVHKPLLAISHHFFGKSIFKEAGLVAGLYVYTAEYLMKFVYRRTPFVVVSESTLDEFKDKGYSTDKFTIVQNAIDSSKFKYEVGEKNPFPTITYFGRIKKYKSVDHLFLAFAEVKQKINNARLHILGRGDFRPFLEELSNELGISDSVKFFGFVSDEEKVVELGKSHIVVNTSMKEGWGITNIEANAAGTPVVSADVPGLRDSVKVGSSGLLYPYADTEELARQLLNILSDSSLRDHLSHGAVEWAKQFSWDKSAEIMMMKLNYVIKEFN